MRLEKEKNSVATLYQVPWVEQNYPPLMVEHVNDILQRIRFILSMNVNNRPISAIRQSAKNRKSNNLKKANIHFEEFQKQDSSVKYTNNLDISIKLKDWSLLMKIVHFSSNSKEGSKSYWLEEYEQEDIRSEEDVEFKSNINLSKGVKGYNTFKGFLMHVYYMVINRIVRTAHLADISTNKKGSKGKLFKINK